MLVIRSWLSGVALAAVVLTLPGVVLLAPTRAHADTRVTAAVHAAFHRVANVAHRGASKGAPENTLPALRRAIRLEADYVGIDVRRTRNDKLVVFHDETLDRTTDVEQVYPHRSPWRVSDFSLREIRRLDAGASWSGYHRTEVPSLADALRLLDGSSTGAFLEVKDPRAGTGRLVHRALRRYSDWLRPGSRDRLVMESYNQSWVRTYHRKHRSVLTSVLGGIDAGDMDEYRWADQVNIPFRSVLRHPHRVRAAHRQGLFVSVHTVNGRDRMRRLVRAGVDAVSTDRPARLRRAMRGE